jgi:malonyl-CoA decarboxylase
MQPGLAGIDLGNSLIKSVSIKIREEFPTLSTLATLSPIPGFATWMHLNAAKIPKGQDLFLRDSEAKQIIIAAQSMERPPQWEEMSLSQQGGCAIHWGLENNRWLDDLQVEQAVKPVVMRFAAHYLLKERHRGLALDQVANFHVRNGAEVDALLWRADTSLTGMKRGFGMMVRYRYDLAAVAHNNKQYLLEGTIAASPEMQAFLN